ncbi:MAG: NAD-dependent protein deacylase [Acidobacteria bacterium]|nr:NAD-dependent protein deacylase [Acidobacteriota bacterium]
MSAIDHAMKLINQSRRIVAFSGAGISTEAGIPDFRSEGGLWENAALMELMSASGFRWNPAGFYRASMQLMPNLHRAQPTSVHMLLAELESQGRLSAIITQNIDGLHQAAGSQVVHEIHGSFRTGHCIGCQREFEMTEFYERLSRGEIELPLCDVCRSPIKPDVILFGDLLPVGAWNRSVAAVEQCDLLLVLGSSLVVYPAAELPRMAQAGGAKLIIVNREATEYDALADVIVHAELGDFSQEVFAKLKKSGC